MNNLGAIQDYGPPPSRDAFALAQSKIARLVLALVVVAATLLWYANIALGAAFTLQDGKRIEGEIIYASKNSVVIRQRSGALAQLGRRTIDQVEFTTKERGVVAGALVSWAEGVYEIETEDEFLKVEGRRIIAERQISPEIIVSPETTSPESPETTSPETIVTGAEIIVTGAEEKENAAELVFKVGLSRPMKQDVLLIYSTQDGTALAGSDYEALRGNVILKPGSTEAEVSVPLLDDDLAEGNETFELLVTSDLDLAAVKVKRGSATILDNEAPAVVRGTDPKEVSRQGNTDNSSQHDAGRKVPGERIGYTFSNMMHGDYCKIAYDQITKASVSGPAAMALGEESCGIGGASNETVADAEAEALEKCKSATTGCRIIFTTGYGYQTGSAEWTAACARKYRSFEPRTGLYTAHSGDKRRCQLP